MTSSNKDTQLIWEAYNNTAPIGVNEMSVEDAVEDYLDRLRKDPSFAERMKVQVKRNQEQGLTQFNDINKAAIMALKKFEAEQSNSPSIQNEVSQKTFPDWDNHGKLSIWYTGNIGDKVDEFYNWYKEKLDTVDNPREYFEARFNEVGNKIKVAATKNLPSHDNQPEVKRRQIPEELWPSRLSKPDRYDGHIGPYYVNSDDSLSEYTYTPEEIEAIEYLYADWHALRSVWYDLN